ncbi:MAG: hypothetical protein R3F65_26535, partial [bacterium]
PADGVAGAPPRVCVDGRCLACRPADNAGCDPDGERPICAASEGDTRCRACNEAAECAALGLGLEGCVEGRCTPCDATRPTSCDAAPDCAGDICRCIAGRCERCDPTDCACAGGAERPECRDLGAPCDDDRQCNGGLCLDDAGIFYCSRLCALGRDDCDPGFICVPVDERPVCVALAPACAADDTCPESTACMPAPNQPDAELACRPERRAGRPVGEICEPASDDCLTGHCIERIQRCGRLCDSQAVCDDGTACVELPTEDPRWCVTRCESDVDCLPRMDDGVQEVCRYRAEDDDDADAAIFGVCDRPNFNGRPVGDPCEDGGECLHGLCLTEQRRCTKPCTVDAHCPEGWQCDDRGLRGQQVAACIPP